jgi:hypothetical protein
MFSNTARAHDLGKTHDWVVIFFEKMVLKDNQPWSQKQVVLYREGGLCEEESLRVCVFILCKLKNKNTEGVA